MGLSEAKDLWMHQVYPSINTSSIHHILLESQSTIAKLLNYDNIRCWN